MPDSFTERRIDLLERQIGVLGQVIERLQRAMRMQMALGRSSAAVVDTGVVQTHQSKVDPLTAMDGIPALLNYGFSSSLPVGGDQAIVFLGSDRSQALVVGTNHQSYRHTGLSVGDTVMYDMTGHSILLTSTGVTVQCAGLPVTFVNAGTIEMDTPLLKVTGDIIDQSATNTLTASATRGVFNTHTHPVPGVEGGSSTATTSAPNIVEN